MTKPPISFSQKASATKSQAGGYPIQISAKDLDANFCYATIEISEKSPQGSPQPFLVDEITGDGGNTQRRLLFNPPPPSTDAVFSMSGGALLWLQPPTTGTYVLGAVNGSLQWLATEEC